jgi:hypothetical protein
MKSEKIESIRENLRSAFPPGSGPRGIRVFNEGNQRVRDDPEMQSMVENFEGKKWTDIQRDCITKHRFNLPLFCEAAYRYYLPAFIDYALYKHLDDTTLTDFILYSLTPYDSEGSLNSHAVKTTKAFSPKQKRLILEFILLVQDKDPKAFKYNGGEALVAYWRAQI